jgi:hypothetical protein
MSSIWQHYVRAADEIRYLLANPKCRASLTVEEATLAEQLRDRLYQLHSRRPDYQLADP